MDKKQAMAAAAASLFLATGCGVEEEPISAPVRSKVAVYNEDGTSLFVNCDRGTVAMFDGNQRRVLRVVLTTDSPRLEVARQTCKKAGLTPQF